MSSSDRRLRYGLLCLAVLCQVVTVIIAWPAWNVRQQPVNLPLVPLPGISFGIPLLVSLAAVLIWPQRGLIAHAAVYGLACLFDQHRLQPQVLSLIVLMSACVHDVGTWLARWYLASMWLWAGLHKFLSAEWLGEQSWLFLHECGISADGWQAWFALSVAAVEVALGLTAAFAPRRAAVGCIVVHLGILLSLSPLVRNFNASVWPWNLATAVVGAWILRREVVLPASWLRNTICAALLAAPAGYYLDLVNPHLAFVLYSGNLPHALHVSGGSPTRLDGWVGLPVPFPDSPRLFVEFFRRTALPGDKLHIDEPRFALADRYYVMQPDRAVREISRAAFLRGSDEGDEVAGLEIEDRHAVFDITRRGVVLERGQGQLVAAATLEGKSCADDTLALLAALPNLHTLRIAEGDVTDGGLAVLDRLPRLQLLEIKRCRLSDAALPHIAGLDNLRWLHLEEMPVTGAGLKALTPLGQLEVLLIPKTAIDDPGLEHLSQLVSLEWLDLSHTSISGAGLSSLSSLSSLQWIKLDGTRVDSQGLRHLASLESLKTIELSATLTDDAGLAHLAALKGLLELDLEGTKISDAGIDSLAALGNLNYLNLRSTRVTRAGRERLAEQLPHCRIDH